MAAITPTFSIIVAHDLRRGIGIDNEIPFRFPTDMANFKMFTEGNIVIMGRHTFLSIKRELPNRINIIVSHDLSATSPQIIYRPSFNDAIEYAAKTFPTKRIYVIGGEQIYKLAINDPRCNELIITMVFHDYGCNKFFPNYTDKWLLDNIIASTVQFQIWRFIRRISKGDN